MKKSPNNDVGLDAMLSIVAHEISETATDPLFKSWYDINGEENADLCVWEYGIRTKLDSNGAVYNQVIGGANFLIQNNYDLERNACHDGQGEARAVEAPSMTPSTNWWDALFANIARFFGRR